VFTRVDNPQAQGFEVESIAAHHFTPANSHVLGLKRTAEPRERRPTASLAPLANDATLVSLWSSTNTQIGTTKIYDLAANEFRRLLDIFAEVGAPRATTRTCGCRCLKITAPTNRHNCLLPPSRTTPRRRGLPARKGLCSRGQSRPRTLTVRRLKRNVSRLGPYNILTPSNAMSYLLVQASRLGPMRGGRLRVTTDLEMRLVAQTGLTHCWRQ